MRKLAFLDTAGMAAGTNGRGWSVDCSQTLFIAPGTVAIQPRELVR
jgi:hypothetical protein